MKQTLRTIQTATNRFADLSCSMPSMSIMVELQYIMEIVAARGSGGCVSFKMNDRCMVYI